MCFRKASLSISLFVAVVISSSGFYYNSRSFSYVLDYFELPTQLEPSSSAGIRSSLEMNDDTKMKKKLVVPDGQAMLRQKYSNWGIPLFSVDHQTYNNNNNNNNNKQKSKQENKPPPPLQQSKTSVSLRLDPKQVKKPNSGADRKELVHQLKQQIEQERANKPQARVWKPPITASTTINSIRQQQQQDPPPTTRKSRKEKEDRLDERKRERSDKRKRQREVKEQLKLKRQPQQQQQSQTTPKQQLRRSETAIETTDNEQDGDTNTTTAKEELIRGDPYTRETVAFAVLNDPNNAELAQKASNFYQYHFEQMKQLVNYSNALVWGTPDQAREYGAFLAYFRIDAKEQPLYVVPEEQKQNADPSVFLHGRYIYCDNVCRMAQAFRKYERHYKAARQADNNNNQYAKHDPSNGHIMILGLNENWGSFSQTVVNKTVDWTEDLEHSWQQQGCSRRDIDDYLDNPNTKAVITTQFQIMNHPKVHSIPLGMVTIDSEWKDLMQVLYENQPRPLPAARQYYRLDPRPQLLMINSSPTETRSRMYDIVSKNFRKEGMVVRNSFKEYGFTEYRKELRRSKFILSPSGMGMDCYRHWEAMYMGTIPVIEHLNRDDGWYRTLDNLPVAMIDSYSNLTPQWLEQEYIRIMSRPLEYYEYERLTKDFWIKLYKSSLEPQLS
ncbi:expressed unknown protein [Seminavis robusta]|uniref:RXYLT1 C-terminal domain-containing protein n=1 Tax=Seminavis robusta TaxID=568900 RepID=A0A9N8F2W6_9STRA|nr:expressed unknown protein [Seminavis robusta]|eukprot:Sro2504_g329640.1 n/a (668) ;mRNA; r:9989-11992